MDLRLRLFSLVLLTCVLAATAFQITRQLQPKHPSRESIGLDWLRHEYQLSDAAFSRISALHHNYFARCDAMCAEMIAAHRPSSLRSRLRLAEPAQDERRREKAICERCLETMIGHLRSVAAQMEPAQGSRFLADILPEVLHPPELEQLQSQTSPVQ
jgi:hypothetical protein